jgi:septum site-determining protein MinD
MHVLRSLDTSFDSPAAPAAQGDKTDTNSAPKLGRAIVVTSGKGGVGKTTTTANVGTALAQRGANVALIDADVGLRNLDIVLGLESRVKYHVLDVLEEKVSLDEALVTDKHSETMRLLAAAQSREKDEVDTEKMQALVQTLRERFDYVLIDCPAGIELGFKNAVAGAQEAIVVCTPEVAAVRDVDRVVGLLGNRFKPQLIINRLRPQLVRKGKMLSVEDVNAILRLPLLGVIADEPEIIITTNKGVPLALRRDGETASAYHKIAARIAGEDVAAPAPEVKESFMEKLGSFFGGRRA